MHDAEHMATATIAEMFQIEKLIHFLLNAPRKWVVISLSLLAIGAVAVADWLVGPEISLGGMYIFPMLFAATVLPPRAIVLLALLCASLRCTLDDSHLPVQYAIRFVFALLTYVLSGLFVLGMIRNRKMALEHVAQLTMEKRLRNEAQERLQVLVESSPAAIVTLSHRGTVIASNHAANVMFGVETGQTLEGRSIETYMPVLTEALRLGTRGGSFRTAAQAQGRRENGQMFLADLWFSTYAVLDGIQLAAIMVDCSDEMRDREQQNFRNLSTSSRLVAGAVLHEIRNICSAISVVYSNLKDRETPCRIEEIHGLGTLITGLGRVAALELYGSVAEPVEEVPLRQIFDELRIIIEPGWLDMEGCVSWEMKDPLIRVHADRFGLMQVFLNLAQNSQRAVQTKSERKLHVTACASGERALITFRDTGCGIAEPHLLFQPFQENAKVTGLGLFISRALARSFGGDLWFEPAEQGSSFVVELPLAETRIRNA
jgi:PAS domain S-box-containing protein